MVNVLHWFIPLSIHPLFFCTIFFILGIAFQSLNYSFYCAFMLWGCGIAIGWVARSYTILFIVSFFISGAALYQQTINNFATFHDQINNVALDIKMTVTDISTTNHNFLKYKVVGTIENLSTVENNATLFHAKQNVVWYSPKKPPIQIADIIKFRNTKILQPKAISMKDYFQKNNIVGTIINPHYELIFHPTYSFFCWLHEYRASIIDALKHKVSQKTFLFLLLLFFGNKEIKKKQLLPLQNDCKCWGISHYLARSGLHLILFVILWEMLLKLFTLPFLIKQITLTLITFIYALLSWPTISFIRSLAGFFLYKIGMLSYHQMHTVHIFTIITLCTLLFNPLYLFFLDFQLSFGITFLLTWANYLSSQRSTLITKNS